MAFTVSRVSPHDVDAGEESRQVAVQLLRDGVSLERVPRVPAEADQNGWRYVWASRDDAESAAEQLQRRTGGRWEVRETDAEPSLGPLTWLQVDATRESDGWVFALDPVTRIMIERRFSTSCRHRRVFVAVESDDDVVADVEHFDALARQALFLLTWLPEPTLAVFGRFRVYEPLTGRVLLAETNIDRTPFSTGG